MSLVPDSKKEKEKIKILLEYADEHHKSIKELSSEECKEALKQKNFFNKYE